MIFEWILYWDLSDIWENIILRFIWYLSEYYIEIYLIFEWEYIHILHVPYLSLIGSFIKVGKPRFPLRPHPPCFLSAFYIIILILNRDILRPRAPQLTQKWMLKVSIQIGVIIRAWLNHDSILCLARIDVET